MRTKLTALIAASLVGSAALGAALAAQAAPVTVALYSFQTAGDVAAFSKALGAKCGKKWQQNKQMSIAVRAGTNRCVFRTSVVGDSTDPGSDMDVAAAVSLGGGLPGKLQKKAYAGVGARQSDTSGYELRILIGAQKWQLFRDPRGTAPAALVKSGTGKFIRTMGKKPNQISLQAFDGNTPTTTVTGIVNGKAVITYTDAAADQPDGRRSVVLTGVKGTGSGSGVVGIFDNVAIKVPSPF
jgi:hypothetical protein